MSSAYQQALLVQRLQSNGADEEAMKKDIRILLPYSRLRIATTEGCICARHQNRKKHSEPCNMTVFYPTATDPQVDEEKEGQCDEQSEEQSVNESDNESEEKGHAIFIIQHNHMGWAYEPELQCSITAERVRAHNRNNALNEKYIPQKCPRFRAMLHSREEFTKDKRSRQYRVPHKTKGKRCRVQVFEPVSELWVELVRLSDTMYMTMDALIEANGAVFDNYVASQCVCVCVCVESLCVLRLCSAQLRRFVNNRIEAAIAFVARRTPGWRDHLQRRTLRKYCKICGLTNWTMRTVWQALYLFQWVPTLEKMKKALAKLRHQCWCIDVTYPCHKNAVALRDYRVYVSLAWAHNVGERSADIPNAPSTAQTKPKKVSRRTRERLLARKKLVEIVDNRGAHDEESRAAHSDSESDIEDEFVELIKNVHEERARKAKISGAQLVVSNEYEIVHDVQSVNGMSSRPSYYARTKHSEAL